MSSSFLGRANLADDSFASSSSAFGICIFHEHPPELVPVHTHAPACLRVCTRLCESGAGAGHWMEIMKALVQGPGKEDKFGNARWGKEEGREGANLRQHIFTHGFGGCDPEPGRRAEPPRRTRLSPRGIGAAQPSAREEEFAAAVWCPILPENYIRAQTLFMQMSFFGVLLGPRRCLFFPKQNKKKLFFFVSSILVNSIFTAVWEKGKTVSVPESLTMRWFRTLNNPEITDDPNPGVQSCFLQADRQTWGDRLYLAYLCPVLPARKPL